MWIKLNRNLYFYLFILASGQIPCPRAAHAAASAENNRLLIFGGAIVGKLNILQLDFKIFLFYYV